MTKVHFHPIRNAKQDEDGLLKDLEIYRLDSESVEHKRGGKVVCELRMGDIGKHYGIIAALAVEYGYEAKDRFGKELSVGRVEVRKPRSRTDIYGRELF